MKYIDSHLHLLQLLQRGIDYRECLESWRESGLVGGLDVGVVPTDLDERPDLRGGTIRIRRSSGMYPGCAERGDYRELLRLLEEQLEAGRVDAVGETGIDLHHAYATRELQEHLFLEQIRLANRHGLPVIIHNRNADGETAAALSKVSPTAGGIMHCFSSDYRAAKRWLEHGLLVSFAGNVTYPKAEALRETARRLPLELILLETDSPYLAPQKFRGKTNTPALIIHTYDAIAEIRDMTVEELVEKVRENFERVFRR
jgi:TatD DNase family protein